jgi:hypothetical protein
MTNDNFNLALVRFTYDTLGYETTVEGEGPFKRIAKVFNDVVGPESSDAGQTRWFSAARYAFAQEESSLSNADVQKYDSSIETYLDRINRNRTTPLELRYYQYMAVFLTEYTLDKLSSSSERFVDEFNRHIRDELWNLDDDLLGVDEFNKLAYWMATGSGKTYIMHINYMQYLEHFGSDSFDNAILIAPTQQVAEQHLGELESNGVPHSRLSENSEPDVPAIQVTDINKLKRGESGPKTVDIEEFGTNNLILVDEGHKGLGAMGGSSSAWVDRRDYLTRDGFAFEYSATFASSLSNAKGYQEYSRSIIFDYPYGRFHEDRYGKDYNIVNVSPDGESAEYIEEEQKKWLLSNLLSYYEKVRIYEENSALSRENNIEKPLSVFVGNSVNAVGRGGKSDVQTIVEFLGELIQNDNGWVTSVLKNMIREDDIFSEGGLFGDRFGYLRSKPESAINMYSDLVSRLFESDNPSRLSVVRLKNLDDEELALTTDATDSYFGVITVGDTKDFYELIENADNSLETVENEVHSSSLFEMIDKPNSPVNFLIGAKKFAEGWDSVRPSTMGLLNIGRSEGPMVVQMFGRGVRVEGKSNDGKRADPKKLSQKDKLPLDRLETLDVFGVRAEYIESFREHLKSERVDVESTQTISVDVSNNEPETSLLVPEYTDVFKENKVPILPLETALDVEKVEEALDMEDARIKPDRNLSTKGQKITDDNESQYTSNVNAVSICDDFELETPDKTFDLSVDILDWSMILKDAIDYKNKKGYTELVLDENSIKSIIKSGFYELRTSKDRVRVNSLEKDELAKVESLCLQVITKLLDNLYSCMVESAKQEELKMMSLDEDWIESHTPSSYDIEVKNPKENEELIQNIESSDKKIEMLFKSLHQLYKPVYLDSEALSSKSKEYSEKIESISPEGIDNMGESKFLDALESNIDSSELSEKEVLIMRNQSNSGVRIPVADGNFYPDFVIWVTHNGVQHIILADPHGLILGDHKSKVNALTDVESDRFEEDVAVHSCIFGRTKSGFESSKREIENEFGNLHENNIFLIDDESDGLGKTEDEVSAMVQKFLSC